MVFWGFFFALLVSVLYTFFAVYIRLGWRKAGKTENFSVGDLPSVSIIVCFRNEEKNLDPLIASLMEQEYPKNQIEILLIDDHSTDASPNIARQSSDRDYRIHYLPLPEGVEGKHDALTRGIRTAAHSLILTIDADCIASRCWVRSMVLCQAAYNAGLVLGPVKMSKGKSLFTGLQALEECAIMGVTAGMAGQERPVLSNGANMLFYAKDFIAFLDYNHSTELSGDDIRFLHFIKKEKLSAVVFNKSTYAIVTTLPQNTLRSFHHQRRRWSSKTATDPDREMLKTAFCLASANILLFLLFVLLFFNPSFMGPFIILLLCKINGDLMITTPVARFFNQTSLLFVYVLPLFILYPLYIAYYSLGGQFGAYCWKNRVFKK